MKKKLIILKARQIGITESFYEYIKFLSKSKNKLSKNSRIKK